MIGSVVLASLAGGVAGLLGIAVVTALVSSVGQRLWGFDPRRDGQFVLVYVFALPVGVLLGAVQAGALTIAAHGHSRAAGALCLAPSLSILFVFCTWVWPDIGALTSPWAVVPVSAALATAALGVCILLRQGKGAATVTRTG